MIRLVGPAGLAHRGRIILEVKHVLAETRVFRFRVSPDGLLRQRQGAPEEGFRFGKPTLCVVHMANLVERDRLPRLLLFLLENAGGSLQAGQRVLVPEMEITEPSEIGA